MTEVELTLSISVVFFLFFFFFLAPVLRSNSRIKIISEEVIVEVPGFIDLLG
jgi:hypothetical protein